MTVQEIARATNRITGHTMYLCVRYDGTYCLMQNGICVKNGKQAKEVFEYLAEKNQ